MIEANIGKYYLKYRTKERNKFNAGSKAVNDCNFILEKLGYKPLYINISPSANKLIKLINAIKLFSIMKLKKNDVIVIPHPIEIMRYYINVIHIVHKIKKIKTCYLIHDMLSVRFPKDFGCEYIDHKMIKDADFIIAHNRVMKEYIYRIDKSKKIVSLDIFDYLGKINFNKKRKSCTLNIAGNLSKEKAQYLYHMKGLNENISLNLYGANYNQQKNHSSQCHYFGKFPPDEVPTVFVEGFGLIWDGTSIETCSGDMGNYLRYNNPHELSLYLSAGLPVVVWKKSAIKKFVLENNVGIAVNSINEFYERYVTLKDDEYQEMCENANKIAKRLHSGQYLKKAIRQMEIGLS